MKLKNKILLLIIFSILIFLITGSNVFATDLNTYVSPNAEVIKENLPIPSDINNDNFVRIITSQESSNNQYQYIYLYYFDKNLYDNFSKIVLYEHASTDPKGSYSLRPYTENNKQVWTDSTCSNFYGFYKFKTQDFLTYELDLHRLPDDYSSDGKPNVSSSRKFISANIDIYDTDFDTLVFQRPVEQSMVGLIPLETMRPTQVQEKIAETLKIMIPISLIVFSALLSPFLIRYLIYRLK